MRSNTLSRNMQFDLGMLFCYILFFVNLVIFITLLFIRLPTYPTILFFEQHHLNIFLLIITSGCLLGIYKNLPFFRMISWYSGLILLLSCLLLFLESVVYSNYIMAYFQINEKNSLLTILSFALIAFSLLDISLMKISARIVVIAYLLIAVALIGIFFNIFHFHYLIMMPIYSAVNFILLAFSLLFLYR